MSRVPACPACAGSGALLGPLGTRKHYRCRSCGWDFSVGPATPQAQEAARLHASGVRLLAAMPANHPHRTALEQVTERYRLEALA